MTDKDTKIPESIREQKHILRFGENGEFRVLVLSDTHGFPPVPCAETIAAVNLLIEREKPDLLLFCGDNILGCETEEQLRGCIGALAAYPEEHHIPWAHVFGNHDDECSKKGGRRLQTLHRSVQQKIYESYPYCVSKAGPENIPGSGNYVLPVYAADKSRTDPVFAVWGLDSHADVYDSPLSGQAAILKNTMYQGESGATGAYIPFAQIRWYFSTSEELEAFAGHRVPGLMAFHIPREEFYEVALNPEETSMTGEKRESVCASPFNSGLFAAMMERGDIKAVCCGHDHVNDYAGTFCGICLAYVSHVGYETYHNESMMGGRVFVIREDAPEKIETYMSYAKEPYRRG